METKQQTDEITGTPLNSEQAETTLQSDNGKKTPLYETTISPSEVSDTEAPLKRKKSLLNWIKNNIDSKQIVNLIVALTATIIGGLIVFFATRGITNLVIHHRCYSRPYITFESDFTQVFRLSKEVPNLEYSIGESSWKELGTKSILFGGNRGNLLLRGKNEKGTAGATIIFATNSSVFCTGDIRTLIDYKNYNEPNLKKAFFLELFKNCTQLVTAPELPATVLQAQCYQRMFYGCSSLKLAPELPATILADWCYYQMFLGCTSLQVAPELPAKDLTDLCYLGMFYDCSSLERAPKLPATDLAKFCYDDMFYGCTSLRSAPDLPATELAEGCYRNMFRNCTSLSSITILAIDSNTSDCLEGWIDNTSQKGTFYKNKNAKWSNKGIVPPGWKVVLVDP